LLFGMSIQAQAHSILLTWGASPDATANPTMTYNVYRMAGSCPVTVTTGFTKINTAAISTLTYSDANIPFGVFCYYVTAAVGDAESGPSSTVTMAVLPSPPSSLKAVVN
jgi:hypothetical protein